MTKNFVRLPRDGQMKCENNVERTFNYGVENGGQNNAILKLILRVRPTDQVGTRSNSYNFSLSPAINIDLSPSN